MTPTTDERLASIVRALTEVVLPHLPAEASLAREQVQLAVGHLQILRSQLDAIPDFEREELADAIAVGRALADAAAEAAGPAAAALRTMIAAADGRDVRGQRRGIHAGVDRVIRDVWASGGAAAKASLTDIILSHERDRAQKDRRWFLPYGFDTM